MWGIPGSHKNPTTKFYKRNKEGTLTLWEETAKSEKEAKKYDILNNVCLEVTKGSIIIMHGDFVHYSGDNTSDYKRNAYTMHFVENHNLEWSEDNWLQRKSFPFYNYYNKVQNIKAI